jgi:flagellar protein FliO/FliZ
VIFTATPHDAHARLLKSRQVIVWTVLSLVSWANVAVAADTKPFAAPQVAEHAPVSTAGSLAQVTVSLLLVLAAVFLAAWLMGKLRGLGSVRSDAIKVIADLPLGAKERAVLVQVGTQQLLLGVAPGRVNTLHVWPEGQEPVPAGYGRNDGETSDQAKIIGSAHQARPDFKSILKRSLGL